MAKYSRFLSSAGLTKTSDILSGKYSDADKVTVAGIINNLKVRQLKNNKLMASCQIEDVYASVSVTVFEAAYVKFKPVLSGTKPVILTGRISEREDRDVEIVALKIEELPETAAKQSKKFASGLYIKVKNTQCSDFTRVKEILSLHTGETPVYIYCTETGKKLEAPKALRVKSNETLISQLAEFLGSQNIKLVE